MQILLVIFYLESHQLISAESREAIIVIFYPMNLIFFPIELFLHAFFGEQGFHLSMRTIFPFPFLRREYLFIFWAVTSGGATCDYPLQMTFAWSHHG
jgi:hypothetical protein